MNKEFFNKIKNKIKFWNKRIFFFFIYLNDFILLKKKSLKKKMMERMKLFLKLEEMTKGFGIYYKGENIRLCLSFSNLC